MERAANQPMSDLEQYLEGLERWEDATLELLKTRKPGDRHPLVVGTDAYQRFVGIMRECTLAHMARRQ